MVLLTLESKAFLRSSCLTVWTVPDFLVPLFKTFVPIDPTPRRQSALAGYAFVLVVVLKVSMPSPGNLYIYSLHG
jgi:hypothetical protein